MKRITAGLLALLLILSVSAFADELMSEPLIGLEMTIPDDCLDRNVALSEISADGVVGVSICYFNSEVLLPISEEYQAALMDNDDDKANEIMTEYQTASAEHTAVYCDVIGLETSRLDDLKAEYGLADEDLTEIGANSTHTYYVLNEQPDGGFSDEDREKMEESRDVADAIMQSISVIEIDASAVTDEDDMAAGLTSFSTVDMDGNTVTQDIFAQADLTILNIWGTYCAPCIREMPDLAEWANELPEGVQIVGLIVDVQSDADDTYATAQKIIEKSGVTFTNMLYNSSLDGLVGSVTGTPTTLFIDKSGNSVHDMVVGAYIDQYKAALEEIMAQ